MLEIDLKKPIQILLQYYKKKDTSNYNLTISISAKYNNLENDVALGVIEYETITRERAKIINSLLFLIDKIDTEQNDNQKNHLNLINIPNNFDDNNFINSKIDEINKKIKKLRFDFARTNNNFTIKQEIKILEERKQDLNNLIKRKKQGL